MARIIVWLGRLDLMDGGEDRKRHIHHDSACCNEGDADRHTAPTRQKSAKYFSKIPKWNCTQGSAKVTSIESKTKRLKIRRIDDGEYILHVSHFMSNYLI
jgi:hypothetical protein